MRYLALCLLLFVSSSLSAQKIANKKDAEYVIIPEMNHILKNAPRERFANFATYNAPDLPLNEKLIETIITFVLK